MVTSRMWRTLFSSPPSDSAVGDEAAIGRRVVPVDGRRGVGAQPGRIDEDRGGCPVDGGADDERLLWAAFGSFEGEHEVAGDAHAHRHGCAQQGDQALVPGRPVGQGIERRAGAFVLFGHPRLGFGAIAVFEPAVRVRYLDAVEDVDHGIAPGGGRCSRHAGGQPRPMLGRLPWFALERRMRAFFFFVFFDIGARAYRSGAWQPGRGGPAQTPMDRSDPRAAPPAPDRALRPGAELPGRGVVAHRRARRARRRSPSSSMAATGGTATTSASWTRSPSISPDAAGWRGTSSTAGSGPTAAGGRRRSTTSPRGSLRSIEHPFRSTPRGWWRSGTQRAASLALWAAAETGRLTAVVAQAPVSDLHRSWRDHASDDAVVGLLGGTPEQCPDRYDAASPARRLAIGVPQLVIHGDQDVNVPHADVGELRRSRESCGGRRRTGRRSPAPTTSP